MYFDDLINSIKLNSVTQKLALLTVLWGKIFVRFKWSNCVLLGLKEQRTLAFGNVFNNSSMHVLTSVQLHGKRGVRVISDDFVIKLKTRVNA